MRLPTKSWMLVWSPEGRPIAIVRASTMRLAIRLTPKPYARYKGEVYAVEVAS
jgi:hypothetical protein